MKLNFEEFLNSKGIKVGDKVKLNYNNEIYEIVKDEDSVYLACGKKYGEIGLLQYHDFELLSKKTIGEMTCSEYVYKYDCENCIFDKLGFGCGMVKANEPLNNGKERFFEKHPLSEPLRTVIEAELDKEVEE